MTRDEVDALNAQDPTTPLTDDDIERMLAHCRSKEYLSESGGGWKPRAAMLELQRHRAAKAADGRQLATPAAPEPALTSDRPRPGTFLASPYSDDMCSWCGQARWNHNKSATSNLEGVVCPRRAETPLTDERERVRSVVLAVMETSAELAGIVDGRRPYDAAFSMRVADRAAEQLATPSPTVMQAVRDAIAKRHDRALVHETVRQAVLHYRSTEYTLASKIAERAANQLAKQARLDADEVSQTVRDVIATVSSLSGEHYPQRAIEDIATRVAIALMGRTDA